MGARVKRWVSGVGVGMQGLSREVLANPPGLGERARRCESSDRLGMNTGKKFNVGTIYLLIFNHFSLLRTCSRYFFRYYIGQVFGEWDGI